MSDYFGLRVKAALYRCGRERATNHNRAMGEEVSVSSEELILEVGTEGGTLTIWSLSTERFPERFVVKRNEAALGDLLSEEDAKGMSLSGLGTLLTFDEALRTLGRYPWHRFYPLHVHSNFVDAVLQQVTTLGGTEQAERWTQILRRDTSLE